MTRYRQPKLMEVARTMPTWTVDPDGAHGEVFTRRWVVDLILDLAGYRSLGRLGSVGDRGASMRFRCVPGSDRRTVGSVLRSA